MSLPRHAHILDVDLVDFVDGAALDQADAAAVEEHLVGCLSCRIRRQRIAATASIELSELRGFDVPSFDAIESEEADPGLAEPGEIWLTATDDAAMVLIMKVRPNGWGVVVAPVVLDTEVADAGTLVLDEAASPLAVPISVYPDMLNSLTTQALRRRVIPSRSGVDLLNVTDQDPGVSRGTPLAGPADPRHEVRQFINDMVVAADVPTPRSRNPHRRVPASC